MGLSEVYEKYFGENVKQADATEASEAAETAAAAETAETGQADEAKAELNDADIDKALESMSDEELAALAKEVAAEVKESAAKESEEAEKVAQEYFAAGRIFAQGFMAEKAAAEKTAKVEKAAEAAPNTAIEKFASLLEKVLKS